MQCINSAGPIFSPFVIHILSVFYEQSWCSTVEYYTFGDGKLPNYYLSFCILHLLEFIANYYIWNSETKMRINGFVVCVCVCGYIFRSSNEMFRFNWTELMFSALIKETNSELAFSHERFDLVTQTKDKRQSAPMKLIFLQWICCVLPAACLFHAIFHRSGVLMKYLRTMHWLVMRSLIPRSKCYSLHNNNR